MALQNGERPRGTVPGLRALGCPPGIGEEPLTWEVDILGLGVFEIRVMRIGTDNTAPNTAEGAKKSEPFDGAPI